MRRAKIAETVDLSHEVFPAAEGSVHQLPSLRSAKTQQIMSSTPEKREIDAKKYIAMKLARIDGPVVLSSKELEQLGMILNPDTWSISAISTAEKWIGGGSQLSGKDSLQTIAAMNGVRAALGAASRRRLGTAPRRRIGDGEPDQSEE